MKQITKLNKRIKGISQSLGTLYPFSPFASYIHEAGHYLTLIAFGGKGNIEIFPYGGSVVRLTELSSNLGKAAVSAGGFAADIVNSLFFSYLGRVAGRRNHDSTSSFLKYA